MQILFYGICNGLLISLLALAFSLVYLTTGVFYLALAGIYVLAAFITLQCHAWGFSWLIAVVIAISIGVVLSACYELFNHRPLDKRKATQGAHMISSLGIYIIIIQLTALIWGNSPQVLEKGVSPTYYWLGLIIARPQLYILIGAPAIITGFFLWLRCGRLGLVFRGLSDNPIQLALLGYNIDNLRLLAFGIAGGLGAFAGILNAYDSGFDPHIGMPAILLAIVATIVGGRGTFWGPVIGGVMLGIIRSQVVWYMSARWQDVVTFLLLSAFLLLCPNGILSMFGKKKRLEVME